MAYDVSLGGIDFPTFEQDFTETVGSDYALVGSAVLPGPPRPAALYSFTLNIYGDRSEVDRTAAGFDKRADIKALLQDSAQRFAGLEFSCVFDPSIDGYLVIGTGDIAYAVGGATFGDFTLRIQGAVWVPAPLTIHAMLTRTTPLAAPMLDAPTMRAPTAERIHYLPIGATDVVGQFGDLVPETHEYRTLDGTGVYVAGRLADEAMTVEVPWEDRDRGRVRVWDTLGAVPKRTARAGDAQPGSHYGWRRMYGPLAVFQGDPAVDNGRCRVLWAGDGAITVETLQEGAYGPYGAVQTGFRDRGRTRIVELTRERAIVRMALHDGRRRGEAWITLARGWQGPTIDVRHLSDPEPSETKGNMAVSGDARGAFEQFRIGDDSEVRGYTVHQISRDG